jgi:hypothetical protein
MSRGGHQQWKNGSHNWRPRTKDQLGSSHPSLSGAILSTHISYYKVKILCPEVGTTNGIIPETRVLASLTVRSCPLHTHILLQSQNTMSRGGHQQWKNGSHNWRPRTKDQLGSSHPSLSGAVLSTHISYYKVKSPEVGTTNGKSEQQPTQTINHTHPATDTKQPWTNNNQCQRHPTIYSQHSTTDTRQPNNKQQPPTDTSDNQYSQHPKTDTQQPRIRVDKHIRRHCDIAILSVTNFNSTPTSQQQGNFHELIGNWWPTMSIYKFLVEYVE